MTVPTPEGEYFESSRFAGLVVRCSASIALVALVLCVVGAFVDPAAVQFFLAVRVCVFLHALRRLLFLDDRASRDRRGMVVVVRRQLENLGALLAVLALSLHPHSSSPSSSLRLDEHSAGSRSVARYQARLPELAFLSYPRRSCSSASFIFATLLLRRFSIRQDSDGNPRFTIWMRKVSFVSLPLFRALPDLRRLRLAAGPELPLVLDHVRRLHFRRRSRQLDVAARSGDHGSAQAGYLKDVVTIEHYHIMGKWMLAFCVFWAYIGFGQYMLIWYANMPEETQYFITRNTESWWALSMLLVIGRFFGRSRFCSCARSRKHPHQLCIVAGWILFMQMLDMYIIVLPALHGTGVHLSIWDFLSLVAIGATLAFVFLRIAAAGASLFPVRDPRLIESLQTSRTDMADTESLRQIAHSRAPFSTWFGVVLLFALFGVIVLAIIGPSPRGMITKRRGRKSADGKSEDVREEDAKALNELRLGRQEQRHRAHPDRARHGTDAADLQSKNRRRRVRSRHPRRQSSAAATSPRSRRRRKTVADGPNRRGIAFGARSCRVDCAGHSARCIAFTRGSRHRHLRALHPLRVHLAPRNVHERALKFHLKEPADFADVPRATSSKSSAR